MLTLSEQGFVSVNQAFAQIAKTTREPKFRPAAQNFLLEHYLQRSVTKKLSDYSQHEVLCLIEAALLQREQGADGFVEWLTGATSQLYQARQSFAEEQLWRVALGLSLDEYGKERPTTTIIKRICEA